MNGGYIVPQYLRSQLGSNCIDNSLFSAVIGSAPNNENKRNDNVLMLLMLMTTAKIDNKYRLFLSQALSEFFFFLHEYILLISGSL